MDQRIFINVTKITTSIFDNIFMNLRAQQMASNISFEGQIPKTLIRDTQRDSGSNDSLKVYFIAFCLLAMLFGTLYGIYMCIIFMTAAVIVCHRSCLKIELKKTVKKVDKIDRKIQMKDMEIKMNKMEMKIDDLEGKVDEKLTQERLDYQNDMMNWKTQAQKEKNDLEVEIPKLRNKIDRLEQELKEVLVYNIWRRGRR
ncbi:hypothetical protein BPOR_0277g00120 [Botrytis porri]|uniref:Uncharacterized protein n=2 Tax=Botrytis porri TaxID=87229 RepID=A0A4Z1KR91_9HELO|nr:hypothetical protein BPOR_0277g00120 [Botrytis porri]